MPKCTRCDLHKGYKSNCILGKEFSRSTKYFIIQDMPSFQDNKANAVPTGDNLNRLKYLLKKAGIDLHDCYFTSALKCPTKYVSDIKPKHMEACREYLLHEIIKQKPKIIIAMGKWGWQAVSNFKGVKEFRGHFGKKFEIDYELDSGKPVHFECEMITTWGLAGSIKKWEYTENQVSDFKKAHKYVSTGEIDKTPDTKVNCILTKQGLKDFVEEYREVKLASTDFETTGLHFWKHKLINAGYCHQKGIADVIYFNPYKREHFKKWNKEEISKAREINSFLRDNRNNAFKACAIVNNFKHLRLGGHNLKFDAKFAEINGIPYRNFWYDSIRASPIINENLPHALNSCLERAGINFGAYDTALWPYINKDEKKKKSYQFAPPPMLIKYLGFDVDGSYRLMLWQLKQLEKLGMREFFFRQSMPSLRYVTKSEYKGARFNRKLIIKSGAKIEKLMNTELEKTQEATKIPDFNPNSPKQIIAYLTDNNFNFEKYKFKETKTGYSTGKEELTKLLDVKKWQPVAQGILNFKKLSKIKGTYIDGSIKLKAGEAGGVLQFLDSADRVHSNFNLFSPKTSRWSSRGPSFQVFPRPIKGLINTRQFIIPQKGWNFFEADYQTAELKVVAYQANELEMIRLFRNGIDMHSHNVAEIGTKIGLVPTNTTYQNVLDYVGKGNIKYDDLDKDKYELFDHVRTVHKNLSFGLNYGQGSSAFSNDFNITIEKADDLIYNYFKLYKYLKTYRTELVDQMLTRGYVELKSGRRRSAKPLLDWIRSKYGKKVWSSKILEQEIARQAMNFPVQGGVHEIFEEGIIKIDREFRGCGLSAIILLFIHDGIVGECPPEENKIVQRILQEQMPVVFNAGTDLEFDCGIDFDLYGVDESWYGKKVTLG